MRDVERQRNSPEHANLRLDVTPLSRSLEIVGELVVQSVAHADDPVGHALDFALPEKVIRCDQPLDLEPTSNLPHHWA